MKQFVPTETEDVNVKIFYMITRKIKKILAKHISYDFQCKPNNKRCHSSEKLEFKKCCTS